MDKRDIDTESEEIKKIEELAGSSGKWFEKLLKEVYRRNTLEDGRAKIVGLVVRPGVMVWADYGGTVSTIPDFMHIPTEQEIAFVAAHFINRDGLGSDSDLDIASDSIDIPGVATLTFHYHEKSATLTVRIYDDRTTCDIREKGWDEAIASAVTKRGPRIPDYGADSVIPSGGIVLVCGSDRQRRYACAYSLLVNLSSKGIPSAVYSTGEMPKMPSEASAPMQQFRLRPDEIGTVSSHSETMSVGCVTIDAWDPALIDSAIRESLRISLAGRIAILVAPVEGGMTYRNFFRLAAPYDDIAKSVAAQVVVDVGEPGVATIRPFVADAGKRRRERVAHIIADSIDEAVRSELSE